MDCFVAALFTMTILSSLRTQGPIITGVRHRVGDCQIVLIDKSRGIGPGSRSHGQRKCVVRRSLVQDDDETQLLPAGRHEFAFSQRNARGMPDRSRQNTEGAGNAGCPMHPQPRVRNNKAHELATTGSPQQSGIPCAMVLTVSFVLSPVTGLFATVIGGIITHQLDASVGASGPHDFAVRVSAVRRPAPSRPPHPAPRS
jgi:hypothetical protein